MNKTGSESRGHGLPTSIVRESTIRRRRGMMALLKLVFADFKPALATVVCALLRDRGLGPGERALGFQILVGFRPRPCISRAAAAFDSASFTVAGSCLGGLALANALDSSSRAAMLGIDLDRKSPCFTTSLMSTFTDVTRRSPRRRPPPRDRTEVPVPSRFHAGRRASPPRSRSSESWARCLHTTVPMHPPRTNDQHHDQGGSKRRVLRPLPRRAA